MIPNEPRIAFFTPVEHLTANITRHVVPRLNLERLYMYYKSPLVVYGESEHLFDVMFLESHCQRDLLSKEDVSFVRS